MNSIVSTDFENTVQKICQVPYFKFTMITKCKLKVCNMHLMRYSNNVVLSLNI